MITIQQLETFWERYQRKGSLKAQEPEGLLPLFGEATH